jgi:hypothetical protein
VRIGSLLLVTVILAVALGTWKLTRGRDAGEQEVAPALLERHEGGGPGGPAELTPAVRVARSSGLQTAVPDVLGYDEKVATFALEQGGFRVRVMERAVVATDDEGVVVQQLPPGGVTRRVGWIVTIVVGKLR